MRHPIFRNICAPTESCGAGARDDASAFAIELYTLSLRDPVQNKAANALVLGPCVKPGALSHLGFRAAKLHLFVLVYQIPTLPQLRKILLVHEVFRPCRLLFRAV